MFKMPWQPNSEVTALQQQVADLETRADSQLHRRISNGLAPASARPVSYSGHRVCNVGARGLRGQSRIIVCGL